MKEEEQQKLGALVRGHPEYEDRYARIMGGDAPGDASGLGAQIMENTAMTPWTAGPTGRSAVFFPCRMPSCGGMAACLLALLALRAQRRAEEDREAGGEAGELRLREEGTKERLIREEQETKSLVTDISHQLKTPVAALG